jgi:hypothetical protein
LIKQKSTVSNKKFVDLLCIYWYVAVQLPEPFLALAGAMRELG